MRVVGAGLGRTGTSSLKLALEQLLGGRCYHMTEVFGRPEDVAGLALWLAGDEAVYASGQLWTLDGGLTAQVQQMRPAQP